MRERESRSTCLTPGERLRQSLREQTKNEVARRGPDGQKNFKKSHFKVYSLEEKLLVSFSRQHDESWRCVHVDVRSRKVGEVRQNCGFAYAGRGQIMNLSQISGHVLNLCSANISSFQSL